MLKVKINNKVDKERFDLEIFDYFQKIAEEAARLEGYSNAEISIALVDDNEIKRLNKKYRDKDEPTDVLSFPLDKNILGDIVISVETATRQARQYGHSLQRELCFLFTHGILHIFGYDHQNTGDKKQMRQKEERILSKFNLERDQEV